MFRKEPLEGTINRLFKKMFDFAFALAVNVLVFPWLFPILFFFVN
jgi:undecaprenyl-phosphate galactose phosphotransferase/putative colanic acid biosynthesis UDP-glucose lipid carrier transferase